MRTAALVFVSPIIVALVHQDALAGVACRPLDVDAFLDAHVTAFVRAYSAD